MSGKVERIGWAVRLEDGSWSDSKGWNVPWPQMMDQETAEFVARSWREDADDEDRDDARAILLYADPEGTIESLEAERDELRATVERYRTALEEIAAAKTGGSGVLAERMRAHADRAILAEAFVAPRALNPEEEA